MAFQVSQCKKKKKKKTKPPPMDVVEVSCWVIGCMNILVPPDSSVATVVVHVGMAGHGRVLEV